MMSEKTAVTEAVWAASLVEMVSSIFSERPCLKT